MRLLLTIITSRKLLTQFSLVTTQANSSHVKCYNISLNCSDCACGGYRRTSIHLLTHWMFKANILRYDVGMINWPCQKYWNSPHAWYAELIMSHMFMKVYLRYDICSYQKSCLLWVLLWVWQSIHTETLVITLFSAWQFVHTKDIFRVDCSWPRDLTKFLWFC